MKFVTVCVCFTALCIGAMKYASTVTEKLLYVKALELAVELKHNQQRTLW